MFCSFHKKRLAHDKCSLCESLVCGDCQRLVSGKVYCPNCASKEDEKRVKTYRERSPVVALLLSLFPGLGQVYNDQLAKGLIIFFSSWLIIPWIYGMYDAYTTAHRINAKQVDINPAPALLTGCLVLVVLFFSFFAGGPLVLLKGVPYIIQTILGHPSEMQIRRTLKDISKAAETYKTDHGAFPKDVHALYFGEISYLSEMYCDTVKGPYRYDCRFDEKGYEVVVTPLKEGLSGYRMKSGSDVEKF